MKTETVIKVRVGLRTLELTTKEAKDLFEELFKVFGPPAPPPPVVVTVPYNLAPIQPCFIQPYPGYGNDTIICGVSDSLGEVSWHRR